uniref:Uncharacterized protein n=1 Tax=Parascaris equorum TaxID=6256 RepID=A0A914RGJ1_PAREQ
MKIEETNATEESYDISSDEWLVESADDSIEQEDGQISDEDEEAIDVDEFVDLSKSIASNETSNFWYLLRACALGEEKIGRFIFVSFFPLKNGIDYVVMGEMAFECDAKTNLIDYSAKRKLKRTLLHTVEEVFLCYLYYTRGKFQAYTRRLGELHKRRIGAASAVRLEEYLYVKNARLPEFVMNFQDQICSDEYVGVIQSGICILSVSECSPFRSDLIAKGGGHL